MPANPPIDYADLSVDNSQHARLADALARFDELKDAMDEARREFLKAEKAYKEVREVILAEAHAKLPDKQGILIRHPILDRPLRMYWQVTNRLDGERLKAERPEVHAYYLKPTGAWYLGRQA